MESLEEIAECWINEERYSLVYAQDHQTRWKDRPYWGINTSRKFLYVYNTKDRDLIEFFIFQAQTQYANY